MDMDSTDLDLDLFLTSSNTEDEGYDLEDVKKLTKQIDQLKQKILKEAESDPKLKQ